MAENEEGRLSAAPYTQVSTPDVNHVVAFDPEELPDLTNTGLDWVPEMVKFGIYLFPVVNKVPLVKWKTQSSNKAHEVIAMAQLPGASGCRWAIDLAKSQKVVVDSDVKPEGDGRVALAEWEKAHGALGASYVEVNPRTNQGEHRIFDLPRGTGFQDSVEDLRVRIISKLVPHVDYLGRGYVVLYDPRAFLAALREGLKPVPDHLAAAVRDYQRTKKRGGDFRMVGDLPDTEDILRGVPEGQRDDTLFRACCRWRRLHGDDETVIRALVLQSARACDPPFPDDQAEKCLQSAMEQDHSGIEVPTWAPDWVLTGEDLEEWFWSSRPELETIHAYAKARLARDWAALGAVLARVIANTHYRVELPADLGGRASLNFLVALVAPSGVGKGTAMSVADEAIDWGIAFAKTVPVGTGEGLIGTYAHMQKIKDERGRIVRQEVVIHNRYTLMRVDEIDHLTAVTKGRPGSTLMSMLRSAFSGEVLGRITAAVESNVSVPAFAYRLAMLLGVQPVRSGPLFDDEGGGTPQRFIWMPALDLEPEFEPVEPPAPYVWPPEVLWGVMDGGARVLDDLDEDASPYVIAFDPAIMQELRLARIAMLRGGGVSNPLDSHRSLVRMKVAAGLALLHGRFSVNLDDWRLSEVLMAVSDRTRRECQVALGTADQKAQVVWGRKQGIREVAARSEVERTMTARVMKLILKRLENDRDWWAGSDLRKTLSPANREYMEDAVAELLDGGRIEREEIEYQSQEGVRYRLRQ